MKLDDDFKSLLAETKENYTGQPFLARHDDIMQLVTLIELLSARVEELEKPMKPTPLSAAKTALAILKEACPEDANLHCGYYDAIRALEETIRIETKPPFPIEKFPLTSGPKSEP